ncbi:hypothetical protein U9M48_021554 [Paspalum notatum var. saurae]|uniref:Snurportin-1 n=1 Tax=Paspalum notatum var. saurae TaxID=547442 RepID=A0AAQ3TFV7_PASNO
MAPPPEPRRPYKRPAISDQQRRRELALQAQSARRAPAPSPARSSPPRPPTAATSRHEEGEPEEERDHTLADVAAAASKLRGSDARRWFARQIMLPEWMVDAPPHLASDCSVLFAALFSKDVSFPHLTTDINKISQHNTFSCSIVACFCQAIWQTMFGCVIQWHHNHRVRNGSILHRFPSDLPNGSKRDISGPASSYSILDCIFHETDETYYIIDMICWRGYSLYDCTAEFRFFWVNSKLRLLVILHQHTIDTDNRFSVVPIYECTLQGLQAAYSGRAPYVKDGLLFYNKHAHYQAGITPLALLVLELQEDGKLITSDDPPVVFGSLESEFIQKLNLHPGNFLRFSVRDESVKLVDGKMQISELQFVGKPNRAHAFADSHSKLSADMYNCVNAQ